MYLMKISNGKQLLDVKHYTHFQNAIAAISEEDAFEKVPDDLCDTLGNPRIYYGSYSDKTGMADDFEFRYSNGINIYVGEISTEDTE